jgi:hypothetical protein
MTLAAPSLRTLLGGKSLFHGRVRQPLAAQLNRVALSGHETAVPASDVKPTGAPSIVPSKVNALVSRAAKASSSSAVAAQASCWFSL